MNAQQQTETAPVTVTEILERYERECLHELAPRTQVDYRRHIRHLANRFGSLVATDLEPRTFADFLNVRKGPRAGRSRSTPQTTDPRSIRSPWPMARCAPCSRIGLERTAPLRVISGVRRERSKCFSDH